MSYSNHTNNSSNSNGGWSGTNETECKKMDKCEWDADQTQCDVSATIITAGAAQSVNFLHTKAIFASHVISLYSRTIPLPLLYASVKLCIHLPPPPSPPPKPPYSLAPPIHPSHPDY